MWYFNMYVSICWKFTKHDKKIQTDILDLSCVYYNAAKYNCNTCNSWHYHFHCHLSHISSPSHHTFHSHFIIRFNTILWFFISHIFLCHFITISWPFHKMFIAKLPNNSVDRVKFQLLVTSSSQTGPRWPSHYSMGPTESRGKPTPDSNEMRSLAEDLTGAIYRLKPKREVSVMKLSRAMVMVSTPGDHQWCQFKQVSTYSIL